MKNSLAGACELFRNYANSQKGYDWNLVIGKYKATNINSKTVKFMVSIVLHTITSICFSKIIYRHTRFMCGTYIYTNNVSQ